MINIVGNSIAGLVSAFEFSQKGINCNYYCDIEKVAAFFRGNTLEGIRTDYGMNLLEFTSFNVNAGDDIASYSPWIRNDCGRFVGTVQKFLEQLGVSTYEVKRPEIYFRGKYYDDFIFSNSFQILKAFSRDEINNIVSDLSSDYKKSSILHASNKNNEKAAELSYHDSSLFNHGSLIHNEVIVPFTGKLAKISLNDLPSKFHRHLWFPLYYPETILNAIKTQNWDELAAKTKFYYPTEKFFGCSVEKMILKIKNSGYIKIINRMEFPLLNSDDNYNIITEPLRDLRLPEEVYKIQDLPKAKVVVYQMIFNSNDIDRVFSAINFVDKQIPFYRITLQSASEILSHAIIHVEVGDHADSTADEIILGLKTCGILKVNAMPKQINKISSMISIPSLSKVNLMNELNDRVKNISQNTTKKMSLIGTASCFGTYSFNDQIIQGKKAAFLGIQNV